MITITNLKELNKHIKTSKVIVFDLDDTLYSEKEFVRSGFHEIANKYNNIKDLEDRLWNQFLKGNKAFDVVLKQENKINELDNFINIYKNHVPNIHLYKEASNILNKKNKKIGIITDGYEITQNNKIKSLKIKVDKVIITDSLGGIEYRKPNQKSFEIMRDYFKCEYADMVYIGDNIKKDFIAPKKLGIKCIYFKNKEGLYR